VVTIRRALISVSFKKGILEFAEALHKLGIEIISTGGTAKTLKEGGIPVTLVSDVTGYPEILDGRVKTLHPMIHGALLARTDVSEDTETLESLNIQPIELVVVNLYPFEETVSNGSISIDTAIEQIDIGGPTMIRAAAKNFKCRAVVVNPNRYSTIIKELEQNDGSVTDDTLFHLAQEAFHYTAHYDSVIARYFDSLAGSEAGLPHSLSLSLNKEMSLRYGENPHQKGALYGRFSRYFQQLHGKELSYNNILDLTAAVQVVSEFDRPTIAIIKHNNPCGVASNDTLATAYRKAFECDRTSAFGGVIAVNRPLDMETAKAVNEIFTEVIIAPSYDNDVLAFLQQKKDRRLIKQLVDVRHMQDLDIRSVYGGMLVQDKDTERITKERLKVVTKRKPDDNEIESLLFAWRVAKHVKSNAVIFARGDQTLGIGAGQMSRVDSSKIAVKKAHEAGFDLSNSAAASDGFFPFADGVIELIHAGATAIIQPGGSIRDSEVIDAADKYNICMVFTGIRHFRH
jgi:phosphoribosylaminoimidazolecarboxamide formyltransferase / IMP cyclohydrolase